MSNYTKSTNFASKDTLQTGEPLKVIKGTEIDDEFNNIQTAVNSKADINSPSFSGSPTAPTKGAGTADTSIATTAFVANSFAPLASPALTGTPTATTAATADDSTRVATTAYVKQEIDAIPSIDYATETTAGTARIYLDGSILYIYTQDAP